MADIDDLNNIKIEEGTYIPMYESIPLTLDADGKRRQEELLEEIKKAKVVDVESPITTKAIPYVPEDYSVSMDGDIDNEAILALKETDEKAFSIFDAFMKDGVLSPERIAQLFGGLGTSISKVIPSFDGYKTRKKKWTDHKAEKKEKKLRKIAKESKRRNRS